MDKFEKYLGIITNLITIGTILPIFVTIIGIPIFHNLFRLRQSEIFGAKGYVYYEPLGNKEIGNGRFWFLLSKREDDSFKSLETGDILLAGDDEVNIRLKPNDESRRVAFVQKSQCVILLNSELKTVTFHEEKSDEGGFVYVGTTPCSSN